MSVFLHPRFSSVYQQHPIVLVDVGARGGLKSNWVPAKPYLRVIGFEPDPREYQQLVEKTRDDADRIRFFNTALSNQRGPMPLYVAKDRGLTSIFEPDRQFLDTFPDAARFDTVEITEVEADTLDNVLNNGGVTDVDFIKADTQGSELLVLEGGRHALSASCVGVEVEVEFAPIYKTQPLFADVDVFLRGLGFALFDLRPCFWKRAAGRGIGGPRGQMIWADALYLRTLPSLREMLDALPAELRQAKLLKAMSASVLYGYYDYALEMVLQAGPLLAADERSDIERALLSGADDDLPAFPGRRQVAAAAHRLWRLSAERNDAWSISDAELGNQR
jgi:FkbM family methyltransferase